MCEEPISRGRRCGKCRYLGGGRKKDTPCAVCGVLLWSGKGALPAGKRTCRECRRRRNLTHCVNGHEYTEATTYIGPSGYKQCRTCIRESPKPKYVRKFPRACRDCAKPFPPGSQLRVCKSCRAQRQRDINRRKNIKRRGVLRAGEPYTLYEVGERDKWRCHLCRRKVNPNLSGLDAKGPTIDHLLPISTGGLDILANVAVAHRECNIKRGTRGEVQLRMVG